MWVFVLVYRGNLPDLFVNVERNEGHLTFFGGLLMTIVFPTSILGLSIEGIVPMALVYLIAVVVEFIYGFLVGWGITSIFRAIRK